MTMIDEDNIIRLQLKKPKSWNWVLTTSKSSPHISLPIIQLYDAKGRLLVQTTDDSNTLRRSWEGSGVRPEGSSLRARSKESTAGHIKRSRSDTVDHHNPSWSLTRNKHESINRRDKNYTLPTNKVNRTSSGAALESLRNSADVSNENRKSRRKDENAISEEAARPKETPHPLLKSKSYVLHWMDSRSHKSPESFKRNSLQTNRSLLEFPETEAATRHRRSRSDDLFRRKLKYSQESIKRAESDGYRNFITPCLPREKSPVKRPQKNKTDMRTEGVLLGNNASNIEVNFLKHNRYQTRTSSAGTLIISEQESFNNPHRRRRRRTADEENASIGKPNSDAQALCLSPKDNKRAIQENAMDGMRKTSLHRLQTSDPNAVTNSTDTMKHALNRYSSSYRVTHPNSRNIRYLSDPTSDNNETNRRKHSQDRCSSPLPLNCPGYHKNSSSSIKENTSQALNDRMASTNRTFPHEGHSDGDLTAATNVRSSTKHALNRYPFTSSYTLNKPDKYQTTRLLPDNTKTEIPNQSSELFYSNSDIFPFDRLFDKTLDDKFDESECDYLVQLPSTSCDSRKNSEPIVDFNEKKKRRKVRRQHSNISASFSSTGNGSENKWHGNTNKGHLVKGSRKDKFKLQQQQQEKRGSSGGDSDLLQLVRRLSTDHVKMGANVSRHSAKGLSGRRSQSSGSICNGKGRHNDGKICSSLPSYLDDRESNGCNNNHHDCEKPPLDEVERIPPLGDGAPLHWKFSDNQTALCDQGYGSERSPEEEYPPPLPDHDIQCHHHLEPHACYPFITPESTFTVKLSKGSRGLGLSVTGGIDSGGSWPGLIRIKRLFPHQPASACGLLNVGDLLIEANGITLTGLTNYEALEVLRTAPNQVDLKVCRPPPDVLSCVSPISEVPPPPPRREPPTSLNLPSACYSTPEDDYYHGEFEVTLTKIQGSLGFTLRKEDDSALGHYVRALVREPALTDGRIRAGDKIIAVNEVEISPMSHEQAVQFLRQCGDMVKLRLYRDSAQTPVAALSPTETTPRTSFSRKAHLRQEAVDMLNDIAVRKLIPGNQDTYRRSLSPNASPRRLRRQPCPSDASQITDSSTTYMLNDEQFHEGLLQKCSHPFDDDAFNSLFSIESDDGDKPSRPSSLDLYNPNQTPVAARKPRFNFSLAHNAYELNNLDAEVLDAPNLTYNLGNDDVKSTDVECGDSFPQEPASMPHIPIDNSGFSYKNPAYQSAHPQCGMETTEEKTGTLKKNNPNTHTITDDTNMKKWKNVVFNGDEETKSDTCKMKMEEQIEILAIELNRGWNSRLGFSLQGAAGVTYVSAVHADSVAAKDGRLKPGDRVIKVNDESVEHMSTSEIIDLLRIVRGPVCIVVSRIKSNEDCPKSNAAN